jgi:hypothetical protein
MCPAKGLCASTSCVYVRAAVVVFILTDESAKPCMPIGIKNYCFGINAGLLSMLLFEACASYCSCAR